MISKYKNLDGSVNTAAVNHIAKIVVVRKYAVIKEESQYAKTAGGRKYVSTVTESRFAKNAEGLKYVTIIGTNQNAENALAQCAFTFANTTVENRDAKNVAAVKSAITIV